MVFVAEPVRLVRVVRRQHKGRDKMENKGENRYKTSQKRESVEAQQQLGEEIEMQWLTI